MTDRERLRKLLQYNRLRRGFLAAFGIYLALAAFNLYAAEPHTLTAALLAAAWTSALAGGTLHAARRDLERAYGEASALERECKGWGQVAKHHAKHFAGRATLAAECAVCDLTGEEEGS